MTDSNKVFFDTVDGVIQNRIAREMRMEKRKEIVEELLETRLNLLNIFGVLDDVSEVPATQEEIVEFSKRNNSSFTFQNNMAVYRDKRYPIFSDDYGQSDFVVIDGQDMCMGTYNIFEEYKGEIGYLAERAEMEETLKKLFPEDYK